MNKIKAQRIHAKNRFLERFGLYLNKSEYKDLITQIQTQKATCIGRDSNRITKWLVKYNNEQLIAIYDKNRHQIVTFYPVDEDYKGDFKS